MISTAQKHPPLYRLFLGNKTTIFDHLTGTELVGYQLWQEYQQFIVSV